jgi:hypothetical protein
VGVERNPRRVSPARRQQGQAIFLAAVFLLLGISAVIYVTVDAASVTVANRQAEHDAKVLAQVKDALIGWSAARTPPDSSSQIRPGELPCPDISNTGNDPGGCADGAIGRVPWKSLGIPEPKDSSGETLWYAISGPFRYYGPGNTAPITSNTLGNLTVYQGSSATTLTSQAVAVLFAPGAALGTQDRSSATAACTTTGGSPTPRNLCAVNYLEAFGGGNNAQTGGPFIQAQSSISPVPFNDRVLAITNADLMPLVEQRVAREMISLLNAYKEASATSAVYNLIPLLPGVYPWAALANGNSNGALLSAYNHNRFPCGTALPLDWGTSMAGWPLFGSGTTPTLPNWLTNGCATLTGWASVIYYGVSRDRLNHTLLTPCSTCTRSMLRITNASNRSGSVCSTASPAVCTTQIISAGDVDMLLITPGGYTGSPARNWPTTWSDITGYFEDASNYDNNDPNNDTYVVPTSTSHNRDRIFIVR